MALDAFIPSAGRLRRVVEQVAEWALEIPFTQKVGYNLADCKAVRIGLSDQINLFLKERVPAVALLPIRTRFTDRYRALEHVGDVIPLSWTPRVETKKESPREVLILAGQILSSSLHSGSDFF